jgi:RNA polymerase sigma-70 factor (ECF subfamily)
VQGSLSDTFSSCARDAHIDLSSFPVLEPRLIEIMESAKSAHPAFELDPEVFLGWVVRKIAEHSEPLRAFMTIHVSDLYLACGCAVGNPCALEEFEKTYLDLDKIRSYLRKINPALDFADQVRALLMEHLLAKPSQGGEEPSIARYSGRGPLAAWLRVTAIRIARRLERKAKSRPDLPHQSIDHIVAEKRDPELDLVLRNCATEFKAAFQTTITALSPDERAVLRFYYLDGMTVQTISEVYRVNKSTVTRWLASARSRILRETNRLLRQRLELEPVELAAMIEAINSQLDLSIQRCLQ